MMTGVLPLLLAAALAAPNQSRDTIPLFESEEPLQFTLTANFDSLRGDRRGETPERPAVVQLRTGSGMDVSVEAQLRTRGRFRRASSNCSFPPLRLNLKKKQTEGTAFEGQDKLKIVGSCRPNRESFEQLVLAEYLTYRAFEIITDTSFRTRLAQITYVDESGENDTDTRYAFLIEDDDALAERIGGDILDMETGKNMPAGFFDPSTAAIAGIFQYMIGNTDWSDVAAHNVEIVDLYGVALPVPYDFDFSGLVGAPYSIPDPSLGIKDVQERRYRGRCRSSLDFAPILQQFRDAEAEVISLFENFEYIEDGHRDRTVRYLKSFFEEIETDDRAQRVFLRYCRQLPT
jgi:hypothetical protein